VKDTRPINVNPATYAFPITAISSIIHRITGVFLFLALPLGLWALDKSLSSAQGFAEVKTLIASGFGGFVTWAILAALFYHIIAGIRHILMDMGIGEGASSGPLGAKLVLVFALIAAVMTGVWLW